MKASIRKPVGYGLNEARSRARLRKRTIRQARGYQGPLPPSLGFLEPSKPEQHPRLIAAFGIPEEPEPGILAAPKDVASVHLTKLKADGSGKADVEQPKIALGAHSGLPVVIAPVNDLLGLAITEGIEDALSVYETTGLGAWAACGASFMPKLAIPPRANRKFWNSARMPRSHAGSLVARDASETASTSMKLTATGLAEHAMRSTTVAAINIKRSRAILAC